MQMGSVLGELIAGETNFDYRLTGNANVGAEIEGFEFQDIIPINLAGRFSRSEEHTSELQSRGHLVCRLLLEKKKRQRTPSGRDYKKHDHYSNIARDCSE